MQKTKEKREREKVKREKKRKERDRKRDMQKTKEKRERKIKDKCKKITVYVKQFSEFNIFFFAFRGIFCWHTLTKLGIFNWI